MLAYKTQVASDIIRDGLGVELLDDRDRIVAEIFRSDAEHTVTVWVDEGGVPLQALETLIARARSVLEPFEDGAPLPAPGTE